MPDRWKISCVHMGTPCVTIQCQSRFHSKREITDRDTEEGTLDEIDIKMCSTQISLKCLGRIRSLQFDMKIVELEEFNEFEDKIPLRVEKEVSLAPN